MRHVTLVLRKSFNLTYDPWCSSLPWPSPQQPSSSSPATSWGPPRPPGGLPAPPPRCPTPARSSSGPRRAAACAASPACACRSRCRSLRCAGNPPLVSRHVVHSEKGREREREREREACRPGDGGKGEGGGAYDWWIPLCAAPRPSRRAAVCGCCPGGRPLRGRGAWEAWWLLCEAISNAATTDGTKDDQDRFPSSNSNS